MRKIMFISLLILVGIFLICAGCSAPPAQKQPTPSPTTLVTTMTTIPTPVPTTISTPIPTPTPPKQRQITDGYWCRKTTINIGNAPTEIRECYQFSPDGTFKWGYSPGYPMGKSRSCSAPNVKCEYSLNPNGKYEVQGGYFYTLSGDQLVDPHDPPYFTYSANGIP
jgi:hypothetical protein